MTKLDRGVQGFVSAFGDALSVLLPSVAYLSMSVVVTVRLSVPLTVCVLIRCRFLH